MNKPTLALLCAIVLVGLTAYWFIEQRVQSTSPDDVSTTKQTNEQKASSYRNPMNPVTTSSIPATDSLKIESIDVSEELVKPNQPLIDSESKLLEPTSKMLEALKMDETREEIALKSERKANATFSIGIPETDNTMRLTPSRNNSTMDVKK